MTVAPFPWFGGKSKVAPMVWERFGDVRNYVEPFFGSGAVLFGRPQPFAGTETINDADGFVANVWRAMQADPETVAFYADWPVNENDLHARHAWLVARTADLRARLEGDPDYYDPKVAGWWIWGCCSWIGSGWCSGRGPWQPVDGRLVKRPHLGDAGMGINRNLPHLNAGMGINRKRPHLGNAGRGERIAEWFAALAERLRDVRVCCGDWSRVCGNTPTVKQGLTAVFLDPPYADTAGRCSDLYSTDSETVAHAVREWCIDHGDDPRLRIALCGYAGEHEMPDEWDVVPWKARGGYGSQGANAARENAGRERIWFSPSCLNNGAVPGVGAPTLDQFAEAEV
jgi:hypothetical protein